MNIPVEILVGGLGVIGLIVSGAVSWGTVKTKMNNYVTFSDHSKMCHAKSDETNAKLTIIDSNIKELIEKVGILKGKTE